MLCALFNVGVVLVVGWEAYNWRAPGENCKVLRTMGVGFESKWEYTSNQKYFMTISYSLCGLDVV